ncbi:MAG: ABC transporter ATP-binding protein [Acidimicrobiales bacterium]
MIEQSAQSPMIEVAGVSKWFGDLVAVSEVTFEIGPGVTALLGPNGAGKSTMLRMLAGLARPSQGTVRVLGRDPKTDVELTRQIALVPQQESVFEVLTGLEFVQLAAELQGVEDPADAARRALELVELTDDASRKVSEYSKGMRQRAKVAHALVHDPQIIILDEPLSGLDPRQRLHMVDLFQRLGAAGRCVIVSSHILEEVERFGSRILVIAQGRLAAVGDFRAIRELMDDRPLRVRVVCSEPRRLGAVLLDGGLVMGATVEENQLLLDTVNIASLRSELARVAKAHNIRLFEVLPLDDDLESVFRYLVDPNRAVRS